MTSGYKKLEPPSSAEVQQLNIDRKAIRKIVDEWLNHFGEKVIVSIDDLLNCQIGQDIATKIWTQIGPHIFNGVKETENSLYNRRIQDWANYFTRRCLFTYGSHNDYILVKIQPNAWALRRTILIPEADLLEEKDLILKLCSNYIPPKKKQRRRKEKFTFSARNI